MVMIREYIKPHPADWFCAAMVLALAVMFVAFGDWWLLVTSLVLGNWLSGLFGWSMTEYLIATSWKENDPWW